MTMGAHLGMRDGAEDLGATLHAAPSSSRLPSDILAQSLLHLPSGSVPCSAW